MEIVDSLRVNAFAGGCACGSVRYRLMSMPMIVHCCHCTWCQRESGAAFALNAMIETDRVELLSGAPEIVDTPTESGAGQRVSRCPRCRVALWSNYGGGGDRIRFVRVGTLDDPARFPPDVHIFARSKQRWVMLDDRVPVVDVYYDRETIWPADSLARRTRLMAESDRCPE